MILDAQPIPMRLPCPSCGVLHVDGGEFATKVHHTHACQQCGAVWRPAVVPTVGVRFLPGFKDEPEIFPSGDERPSVLPHMSIPEIAEMGRRWVEDDV